MTFIDYTFTKAYDGSLILDKELTAEQLDVRSGDCFEVKVNADGVIVLEKKKYNE